jgi:hypothetical protein|nr:MAG: DUF3750 domain-containing protein [Chloroflexota bacterium]
MTETVSRPRTRKKAVFLSIFILFLLPVAARATLFAFEERPRSFREANWASVGTLPSAAEHPQARVLIMSGRTGGWKGVVAVHSWIVYKRENAPAWTRYDVVGWGNPVRLNGWAPDARWYGTPPTVVADVIGDQAQALIPKIEQAVKEYRYANSGDYRLWPGPNSNSFVAAVLRAVPEIGVTMPPNAIGRDFRPGPYLGWTDSGTGLEASLYGLLGVKIGWVEGIEINVLGLVAGLDIRDPAIKLPAFGRIGLDIWSANGAALPAR